MTIRQYKKLYFICKDDFGKKIYAGDTVELYCPSETKTSWTSIVYWSQLYGAHIDSHPAHKKFFNEPNHTRHLYYLLNQSPMTLYDENDEIVSQGQGYCKKIKSFNK
jgi:hypothetical protein